MGFDWAPGSTEREMFGWNVYASFMSNDVVGAACLEATPGEKPQ